MRHFHLCDAKRSQVKLLRQMKAGQPPAQYARNIEIYEGNFNEQERAFAAQKKMYVPAAWWGRDDWKEVRDMTRDERRDAFVDRFKRGLGYRSVKAWPFWSSQRRRPHVPHDPSYRPP